MRALGLTDPATQIDQTSLAPSGAARITGVVQRMLALQGQDWRSARWAIGVRAPGTTVADVQTAFAEGRIVRSWPMRGTVHIVPAEDIGWMQAATNHRVLAGAPKRRAYLGMSDAVLERLVETSIAALDVAALGAASAGSLAAGAAAAGGIDRDTLAQAWTDAGIPWQSNWRYHLIWWLCQNGLATFGPPGSNGEPQLVRADTWIRAPRTLAGEAALGELAARYAAARGPVRERDFGWWTGLTARESRAGLHAAEAAGSIVRAQALDDSGDPVPGAAGALWIDPELLGASGGTPGDGFATEAGIASRADTAPRAGSSAATAAAGWQLLAAFDEHLLGYTDREAQLDPQQFARIVPGRNGMFLPTVVHHGRVVGTWKRAGARAGGFEISPFPGEQIDAGALAPAGAAWAAFHGVEPGEVALANERIPPGAQKGAESGAD